MSNIGQLIFDSLDTHRTQLIEDMQMEDKPAMELIMAWMDDMLDNDEYDLNVLSSEDTDFHEILKAFVDANDIDVDFYDNHCYDLESIWAISIYLANTTF